MEQEELDLNLVDKITSLLAVPLIWPKTTVLVVLGFVGLIAGIVFFPDLTPTSPPPPNPRVLDEILQTVNKESDRQNRSSPPISDHGSNSPDEVQGFFETLRKQGETEGESP